MEERDSERVVFFKRADAIACLKSEGNNPVKREEVIMQKKKRNIIGWSNDLSWAGGVRSGTQMETWPQGKGRSSK